jgi:hypothetical protein
MVADGLRNKEIADKLHMSEGQSSQPAQHLRQTARGQPCCSTRGCVWFRRRDYLLFTLLLWQRLYAIFKC